MLAGNLLCYAGINENLHVSMFPSYGAEMRGGTANSQLIISTDPIGSPVVYSPDILISLNHPSFKKFSSTVKNSGTIFANTSLFEPEEIKEVDIIKVPANNLAEKCGSVKSANVIMLGALLAHDEFIKLSSLEHSIQTVLGERKRDFWDINKKALNTGYNYIKQRQKSIKSL